MNSAQHRASNGKYLVLLLLGVSLLGAVGSFWNYSRHVFSTNHATVINSDGQIEALFSRAITAQLHPHQRAKITLATASETALQGEIVTVVKEAVILQLLEKSRVFSPGEACDVTVDTTVPSDSAP